MYVTDYVSLYSALVFFLLIKRRICSTKACTFCFHDKLDEEKRNMQTQLYLVNIQMQSLQNFQITQKTEKPHK